MDPKDVKRLVDIEAGLDDQYISQVRFGRSRFLRTAGLALFALATGLVAESQAKAAPTPRGCSNAPGCNNCKGATCTSAGCRKATTCGGNHCWRTQIGCNIYKCCDWRHKGHPRDQTCICRGFVGRAC